MAAATPRRIRYSTPIITPEMEEAIVQALRGEPYILADRTKAFERAFREFIGTSHAVAVSSGTAALHLALLAAELGDRRRDHHAGQRLPAGGRLIVWSERCRSRRRRRADRLPRSVAAGGGDHPAHARGDSTAHVRAPDRYGSADGAGSGSQPDRHRRRRPRSRAAAIGGG